MSEELKEPSIVLSNAELRYIYEHLENLEQSNEYYMVIMRKIEQHFGWDWNG